MPVAGLLLAHGAGGGADHRTLVALDDHVEGRMGIPVRRMEFGYRAAGRRVPDRPPKLIAEVRDEAEAFSARIGAPVGGLVIGGRSVGGRMCSMAVAVLSDERYAGRLPLFGGIDKARFRRQATPGDTLELSIEMTKLSARAGRGRGEARVDGALAVECDLLFVIADPE